eukprot:932518-Amphidinium_carterae.1
MPWWETVKGEKQNLLGRTFAVKEFLSQTFPWHSPKNANRSKRSSKAQSLVDAPDLSDPVQMVWAVREAMVPTMAQVRAQTTLDPTEWNVEVRFWQQLNGQASCPLGTRP